MLKEDSMIEIKPEPPRKERKQRIKDQNAKRKRLYVPREPKTPEEFDRQMEGFMMVVLGILKVAGIDPAKPIKKADEFPAEIDSDPTD
jgi:hypothetical protein